MKNVILPAICGFLSFFTALGWKSAGVKQAPVAISHSNQSAQKAPETKQLQTTPELIAEMESGQLSRAELLDAVKALAQRDPAMAWEWWFYSEGGKRLLGHNFAIASSIMKAWLLKDSSAAMREFKRQTHNDRSAAAYFVQECLQSSDPADAALKGIVLANIDVFVALGYANDGVQSPEIAPSMAATLAASPPSPGRDLLMLRAAELWMRKDWKAAKTFMEGTAEPLRTRMMQSMFLNVSRAAGASPERDQWAAQWLQTQASPARRSLLGPRYVKQLAKTDPAAALAFAQEHLAASGLAESVASVLDAVKATNPAKVREMAEQLPPGGVKAKAAFAAVGSEFSAESAEWLRSQADAKAPGWGKYGEDRATKDPASFRKYLSTHADGALPSPLIRSGLEQMLKTDAAAAMDLAARHDRSVMLSSLEVWQKLDPSAAAAWLKNQEAANLPASGSR